MILLVSPTFSRFFLYIPDGLWSQPGYKHSPLNSDNFMFDELLMMLVVQYDSTHFTKNKIIFKLTSVVVASLLSSLMDMSSRLERNSLGLLKCQPGFLL